MAQVSHLNDLKTDLLSIPAEQVRAPDKPIYRAASEAILLRNVAFMDREGLSVRKLDWSLVESLEKRVLALQEAETRYQLAQFGPGELLEKWNMISTEGIILRDELTHAMLYAFFGKDSLLEAVRMIMEGDSYADLVQDQSDMEILGRENKDLLDAAGVDFTLVERAGELKTILGDLLAKVNLEKMEKSPEKDLRDRAFTYMAMAVEKIRKCGRSVYWKNPQHAAKYASDYSRRQRRKSEKSKNEKVTEKEEVMA